MTHVLKIYYEHYKRVAEGTKTFEIRNNDRAFQKGDRVQLRPYDPHGGQDYSDCLPLDRIIGDVYPIDADRVVFSLLEVSK